MDRQEIFKHLKNLGLEPATYREQVIAVDTFELLKKHQICDNCRHDYCGCSVQDSILQIDPKANFTTFGCNSFEPCK